MSLLTKSKNTVSAADQSMHFWGVCCESGKQYAQVVGQRFRITMAVLDPKSFSKEESEKTVSLIVIRGGIEYLLCVLKHEEIHQVNLNLIFDKGENVVFYINGYGKVYLSGYQLTDSESDVLNDENGYLCPLVEVKSAKSRTERKGKVTKTPQKLDPVIPESKEKAKVHKVSSDEKRKLFWNEFVNKSKNGEVQVLDFEESDDSDEEFTLNDEDTESEDEDDSEEYTDEEDEELEDEEMEEEEEQEIIIDSKESRKKRKLAKILQPQKRSRNDSLNASSNAVEKSEVIFLDDNGSNDLSDSVALNSSISRSPMPKKQKEIQTNIEKKSKKKKRLSEVSDIFEKSVKSQMKSPIAESFSNRTDNTPSKKVQKLEGGIEIQDVIVGKGPVATKGKMVHVFYVGQFQDKTVFDSRVPGKKPFSFRLGAQQVIKGWDVGLQGMRVGGKRKLKIPPNMGYGSSKIEGVPANSTLYFIVELQAVS